MFRTIPLLMVAYLSGCFPYLYHSQAAVLIEAVDIPATLEIARIELEEGGFDATLALWAIRDQIVTQENARVISTLYLSNIDSVAAQRDRTIADFGVWHLAWAIANLYRNGDDSIKAILEAAYRDAKARPETLRRFRSAAREHVNGERIHMGDIHGPARSFARSHVVAPGDRRYLQSLDDYLRARGEN